MASKKRGVTARMCARVGASGVGSRPSIPTPIREFSLPSGSRLRCASGADPGNRREAAFDLLERCQSLAIVGGTSRPGRTRSAVVRPAISKPASVFSSRWKLRRVKPGADEQQRGERDLADDQAGSQTAPHVSRRSPAVLQRQR